MKQKFAIQKPEDADGTTIQSTENQTDISPSADIVNKKEEALKNVADTKQKIREVKGIDNIMTRH